MLLLFVNGASGTIFFAHARPDSLVRADAIVVLGGEHDGREAYGLKLAEQGYAHTVLLSDLYGSTDSVMKKSCRPRPDIEVICQQPVPSTTRGEALMARTLAETRGWHSIIVVSWRYHLPRARRIFDLCFTSPTRTVVMRRRTSHLPLLGGAVAVHLPVPVRRVGQSRGAGLLPGHLRRRQRSFAYNVTPARTAR